MDFIKRWYEHIYSTSQSKRKLEGMTEDNSIDDTSVDNKRSVQRGPQWIAFIVMTVLFVFACLAIPSLAWVFLLAFVAGMIGIVYLSDSETIPDDMKLNRVGDAQFGKSGEDYYRLLTEALQFPAYVLDARGSILYANAASNAAFGLSSEGDKIFIRFRQPEIRRLIEKAIISETFVKGEYNEPIPDDRWFAVEVSPIPETEGNRQNTLFILGFHDLTEAKRTDQMRSDFIANASHELRTPLASLQGYIETIKGPARKDDKAIDRFTDVMLDQAQRMTRLVNDLLSLSRIEMQSHVRPSDQVDLTEVISSVIDSLETLASQADMTIEFDHTEPVHVVGARDELLQVFENLIENACKYGEDGKRVLVEISRREPQREVAVSVRDFGPGIAVEHQHRITERFYRVDVARSREKQGTGLGLAIVKHILNRHGTKLNIESSPNEGARFFINFPLA